MKVLRVDTDKCSGARECMTACASTLFKTNDLASSAVQVRKADDRVDFSVCDQCGDCIEMCPTGALWRSKAGTVMLKKDLCVGCFICVGECAKAAMFRAPRGLQPIKCISCGNCVSACPSGALAMVEQDHAGLPA
jgi:ferredoxin